MFNLVTLVVKFFVKTSEMVTEKRRRKHEKFREIAGNSAPELPEFDGKSQKFRQFGVFTKFLSLSKNATLETLSLVKHSVEITGILSYAFLAKFS